VRSYGDAVILGISAFVVMGGTLTPSSTGDPQLVYNEFVVVRNRVPAQQSTMPTNDL
jgi:hypothetical protein